MRAARSVLCLLFVTRCLLCASSPAGTKPQTHPDLKPLQEQGYSLFQQSRYREAADIFRQGLRKARALPRATKKETDLRNWSVARFLSNVASCDLATFQYRKAMRTYLESAAVAEQSLDYLTTGIVYGNIADIHAATHAWPNALAAAERALTWGNRAESKYKASLMVRAASLRATSGDFDGAVAGFREAIHEAEILRETDPNERKLEAAIKKTALESARNGLGYHYLSRGDLVSAEREIAEDLKLRRARPARNLDVALRNLAMLKRKQGDFQGAAELFRTAAEQAKKASHALVLLKVHKEHGELLQVGGRLEEACDEFAEAIDIARRWRLETLPADTVRSSSQAELSSIYAQYAAVQAELSLKTGRAELASRALGVLEENRAASLRSSPTTLEGWQRRLPSRYGEKLAELQGLEAKLLTEDNPDVSRERDRVRAELVDLEAVAGLAGGMPEQRFESGGLDELLRERLREGQLLLSFHLGEKASYVWAASRDRIEMRKLRPRAAIVDGVRQFTASIRNGRDTAAAWGAQLRAELFGGLEETIRQYPSLLLSLDDALFELPFAALVERLDGRRPVYLVENHELQILPSAYMLSPAPPGPRQGEFLGVGDAVYNAADPRWTGPRRPDGLLLPRLPGSGREVRSCARQWGGQPGLLEGAQASRTSLRDAVRNQPAVVHLAGHILRNRGGNAFIALSLGPNGRAENLGVEEIASWPVNARLVVLSGCGSGAGAVLPGAGLMGLTRAWLAAGAASVVASYWPTPDDSGELFLSFYERLRRDPVKRPGAALRQAQIVMLRAGTWRSQPKYWAAYFTVARTGH